MSLTPNDIQRLAQLSRLSFDPPASQHLLEGLNNFFAIVEQMRQVDTSGVEPMAHPIDAMPDLAAYAPAPHKAWLCACAKTSPASPINVQPTNAAHLLWSAASSLVPKVIE